MLRKYGFLLAFTAAGAVAACGGDDSSTPGDEGDGGVKITVDASLHDGSIDGSSDAATAPDASRGTLNSGTYNVSNVKKLSDDCGLTLEDGSFTTLAIVNTGTLISVGTNYTATSVPVQFTPAGYALGSGPYTTPTTANLAVSAHVKIPDDGCEYDVSRTTVVTFTGNNAVSIDYTDIETNQNSSCKKANFESTATCTSHYTFDLSM